MENGWRYYNHAMIPTTAPHENVNLTPVQSGTIWNTNEGYPILARWSSDFDCGYKTNWWYVIKDDVFDISAIKSNYRYKIRKGTKKFEIKIIDPKEYIDELYEVYTEAYNSWPAKYRPQFSREDAKELFVNLSERKNMICYGAFYRENNELCGFIQAPVYDDRVELQVQRVKPSYEKYQINAALVYYLLESNRTLLAGGGYILDGARSISHETSFQDYLEKYFGFRKAYAKLHILYNPKLKWIIKILYRMRKFLLRFDEIRIIHKINSVLKMENLVRS